MHFQIVKSSNLQIDTIDTVDAIDAVVALVTIDASAILPHSNIPRFKHSIIQKFPEHAFSNCQIVKSSN